MTLFLAKAALVLCTVELEADNTYFAVCQGRYNLMVAEATRVVEQNRMGSFCTAYDYEAVGDMASFVVVCE